MFSDRLQDLLPDLRAYARLLCGDPMKADDIVQNACLKAWQSRTNFDPEKGPLRAWLFRILRNDFYSQLRSDKLRDTEASELFESEHVATCEFEPRSDLSRILQAIQTLKRAQRDAFLLVVAAGFTYEEAGEVLGCAPGTVKSRVSRARDVALGRYHSEHWSHETVSAHMSPLEELHAALDRIHSESAAA
ncbi:MAG: sigma-70 family RNA polymerase sigma factor [Pseudomonadota bacterium]